MPRFDRMTTLYLSLPLTRLVGPRQSTRVPILMYHSISDNLFGMSHPYYHINTSAEVFSHQMRWLKHKGFRTLSLGEAWKRLESGEDLSKEVVITFDDGYRDFYTDAMDILKQCGFIATIFLVTDRIRNTAARIEGADYLTWSEVRELRGEGIRFGSHTVTHPDLRSLAPDQIEYELGCSKETIEQELGEAIQEFSYPHAFPEEDTSFLRFLRDLLENQGFEKGACSRIGRAHRKNDELFLPRIPVNRWDDAGLFRAKVEGGYDWMHVPQFAKKVFFHNATLMQAGIQLGSKETRSNH
jgi:peptidoglycan/xylan/chitin deacetylase (PgdA/CDA1 family)